MKILNFGSINIDIVFSVDNIVLPGQTIASNKISTFCGGKGANQSVAVAKSKLALIYHAALIGNDGLWIKEKLNSFGVNTDYIVEINEPTGQAFIQVAQDGQNSIVLYSGANKKFTKEYVDSVLNDFGENDWLMLQNEINQLDYIIQKAKEKKMKICFNPAPYDESVLNLPLEEIDLLSVNETEAFGISGSDKIDEILQILSDKYPKTAILLTLGEKGSIYLKNNQQVSFGTYDVSVVDTTAAGDTFIGYFLASSVRGMSPKESLKVATKAASVAIMNQGAMDSIPKIEHLDFMKSYYYREF